MTGSERQESEWPHRDSRKNITLLTPWFCQVNPILNFWSEDFKIFNDCYLKPLGYGSSKKPMQAKCCTTGHSNRLNIPSLLQCSLICLGIHFLTFETHQRLFFTTPNAIYIGKQKLIECDTFKKNSKWLRFRLPNSLAKRHLYVFLCLGQYPGKDTCLASRIRIVVLSLSPVVCTMMYTFQDAKYYYSFLF
jgi:hypothetical protein